MRSHDGFSFTLDVSQIIHIGMKQAPRVISRVGSMQNLVDHVLQPTVANYFRNSAQQVTRARVPLGAQRAAAGGVRRHQGALSAYDVECIDTLIGDIQPPAELMKTQTDRKIAEELQRTYDVQREAQVKRQQLERETSVANMQGEVVRSEQMVRHQREERAGGGGDGQGRGEPGEVRCRSRGACDARSAPKRRPRRRGCGERRSGGDPGDRRGEGRGVPGGRGGARRRGVHLGAARHACSVSTA